ncbi:MAG: hypothetical protein QXL96_10550 [Ignisphaera sp.]
MVTTLNAIMTEIFTGIRPERVLILREDKQGYEMNLSDVLKAFNINAEVEVKIIGEGIKRWREEVSKLKIDIADITPGRKYMAVSLMNYSNAEIRYAYLKDESRGYRIFGYVPLNEIRVYNVRTGEEISYEPPKTVKSLQKKSTLSSEGLQALLNLYKLIGEVDYSFGGSELPDKDLETAEEMCKTISGFLRFEEEGELRKYVKNGYFFIADTNVYIKLGDRLRELLSDREKGFRLLASKATYNELLEKTRTSQKLIDLKFHLAIGSYRRLHAPPATSEEKRAGDIGIVEEAKRIKRELEEPLALITADKMVYNLARAQGVAAILLNQKVEKKEEGNLGEFLYCKSYYHNNIEVYVGGKLFARILKNERVSEKKTVNVEVYNLEYNYAYVIQELERLLSLG